MTNKEILAELKKSYEYLTDIRENGCYDHCNGQMKDNIHKLDYARGYIEEVYWDFYHTLDKEELRVEKLEKKYNEDRVYIARTVAGDYDNAKDLYGMTCADTDYYWYEDRDFIEDWCEE